MEAVIMSKENYEELLNNVVEIKKTLSQKQKNPDEIFVDNQEFIRLMNISKRTAQNWRDNGMVSFSQIGSKIYYKMSDVSALIEKHYIKSFKSKK
jgi:hypothetical protein